MTADDPEASLPHCAVGYLSPLVVDTLMVMTDNKEREMVAFRQQDGVLFFVEELGTSQTSSGPEYAVAVEERVESVDG